ncbi:MAG: tetratricopeptide repeat protein [Elusimicrobiota bacterium]
MIDIALFVIFVILPFFRVFNGAFLQNIHNLIAIAGIGGVVAGIVLNRLDEYIDRLIRYIIPLLLSTIAVHFFLRTYDSAQIKITLLEVGGPLVLILWIIKRINLGSFKVPKSRSYAVLPALFFILSGLISFLLSNYKLETFEPGLLRRISYLGVFLVTVAEFDTEKDFRNIFNWILATCFMVVIYGYIQYLGYDWHIWKGAFGDRIFSTFGNPNFYAAWIVLLLPLIFAMVLLSENPAKKLGYTVFAAAILYMVWVTNTKGSWVGLAIGTSAFVVLATLFLIKGDPKILKRTAIVIVLFVFIVAGAGVMWFSHKRVNSIRFRLFTWGATLKMISEPIYVSPLKSVFLGHGIETFKLVYPSYRRPEIFVIEDKHNTETDHAHNEFLEILYDEGFLGLGIFLWLLASIYFAAIKRLTLLGIGGPRSKDQYYFIGLIAGALGMLAHASVSVHVRFVSSGYILWTFLGFIVVHTAPVKFSRENPRKLMGPTQFVITAILIALAAISSYTGACRFKANIYHNKAIAYSKQRMWSQALEYYGKVQKNHPSFIMANYFIGNVYNDMLTEALRNKDKEAAETNYKKAVDAYAKVLSMYPNYVQVHFQEGMMHLKVGNEEEAEKAFRRYINIVDPMYPYTYYRLGILAAQKKDLQKAGWYMEEAIKRILARRKKNNINMMLPEGYMNLANIYLLKNQPAEAEKAYKEALKVDGRNTDVLRALASLYERWGRKDAAAEVYRFLLRLKPDNKKFKEQLKQLGFSE